MAVLRVKDINENWVSIPVIATGDADTLQGHPANYFAANEEVARWIGITYAGDYSNISNRVSNLETQIGTMARALDEINGIEV